MTKTLKQVAMLSTLLPICFAVSQVDAAAIVTTKQPQNTSMQTTTDFAMPKAGWTFDVIPYVWMLNMNGRIGVGALRAHLDQDFSDILQKMNFAGMMAVEAKKENLGIFLNALYADLGDDVSDGPLSVDATNHFGILSGGLSYRVYEHCFGSSFGGTQKLAIEPYAGFRYTLNNTTVKLSAFNFSISDSDNQNWTDPILGARVSLSMSHAWSVLVAGDVGGTNHSSDYSYNAMGLIGYSPQTFWTNTTAYVGYRILYQHYDTGSGANRFDWNMKLFGPMLGFAISF